MKPDYKKVRDLAGEVDDINDSLHALEISDRLYLTGEETGRTTSMHRLGWVPDEVSASVKELMEQVLKARREALAKTIREELNNED